MDFDWVSDESDTEAGAPLVFVLDGPAFALPAVPRWRGNAHEDIDTDFTLGRAMGISHDTRTDAQES